MIPVCKSLHSPQQVLNWYVRIVKLALDNIPSVTVMYNQSFDWITWTSRNGLKKKARLVYSTSRRQKWLGNYCSQFSECMWLWLIMMVMMIGVMIKYWLIYVWNIQLAQVQQQGSVGWVGSHHRQWQLMLLVPWISAMVFWLALGSSPLAHRSLQVSGYCVHNDHSVFCNWPMQLFILI